MTDFLLSMIGCHLYYHKIYIKYRFHKKPLTCWISAPEATPCLSRTDVILGILQK